MLLSKVVSLQKFKEQKYFSRENFITKHFPEKVRIASAINRIDNDIDDCKAAIMHAWALKNIDTIKIFTKKLYELKETKEGLIMLLNKK